MPRVIFVKKARKDNPVCKKGESYYWASFKTGPRSSTKRYWLKPPKQSQLTLSKMSGAYAADEAIDNITSDMSSEDISAAIRDVIDQVESVRDEYQDSCDNMEQAFPDGCPTMEEMQEKIDGLESWICDLETAEGEADNIDEPNIDDYDDGIEDDKYQNAASEYIQEKCTVIDSIERIPL